MQPVDIIKQKAKFNQFRQLVWLLLLFMAAICTACQTDLNLLDTYQNYADHLPNGKIAYLRKKGARLYLEGAPRKLYDVLKLSPGDYLINFVYYSDRRRGMAHCQLLAGNRYTIRSVGRQMLPESRTWMMVGKCERISPQE